MTEQPVSRRDELLDLAATMFAQRGLRATTVRDIADSAGILSGSLYHHFKSKEQMVEEVLRDFLDWLFARYQEIVDTEPNPLERLKGLFMTSFEAIEDRHAQVVIYQDEAKRLSALPQFAAQAVDRPAQRRCQAGVFPPGHRRRRGVPVHSGHHLGVRAVVSARRAADCGRSWPPISFHRPRRNIRQ